MSWRAQAVRANTIGMGVVYMIQNMGISLCLAVMPHMQAHGQANVIFQGNKV